MPIWEVAINDLPTSRKRVIHSPKMPGAIIRIDKIARGRPRPFHVTCPGIQWCNYIVFLTVNENLMLGAVSQKRGQSLSLSQLHIAGRRSGKREHRPTRSFAASNLLHELFETRRLEARTTMCGSSSSLRGRIAVLLCASFSARAAARFPII